jgi:mRNA interferase RelE/StbE
MPVARSIALCDAKNVKTVIYLSAARKGLRRHKAEANRIMAKIDAYAANPNAFAKVKVLTGSTAKRLRIGDFRVIFEETDTEVIITDIGPRGSIYE